MAERIQEQQNTGADTELFGTPAIDAGESAQKSSGINWWRLSRYLVMPILLLIACGGLYAYISGQQLDSIEARTLNAAFIQAKVFEHIWITVYATVGVILLAIPAGVLLTRPVMKRFTPTIVAIASIGQALPAIGVLVILALTVGVGFNITIAALIIFAFLPVLRNTMVGLQQVDEAVIESGRGMGMTKTAVLFKIELPLAIPIMLAGIRTALIIVVGTAALATFVNAGGMGDLINNGIKLSRFNVLFTGAVLTAVLALSVDWFAGVIEDVLRPKGL